MTGTKQPLTPSTTSVMCYKTKTTRSPKEAQCRPGIGRFDDHRNNITDNLGECNHIRHHETLRGLGHMKAQLSSQLSENTCPFGSTDTTPASREHIIDPVSCMWENI